MNSRLPLVLLRDWHIVPHVVCIFMFIKVHSVFFAERIFDSIAYEKQRKMKMLFLSMPVLIVGAKSIRLKAKGDGDF